REQVATLAPTQREDPRLVGRAFDAAVPGAVRIVPVLVALEVGLVVLRVVRDELVEREAVMGGDEVDRRVRPAAIGVEIARAGEPLRERGEGRLATPEVPDVVAEGGVPLRPE